MSNFGKIKNIWNLDVVSREEMKTILQEWDDALTNVSLKEVSIGNVTLSHNSLITKTNLGIDFEKPFIVRYTWLDPLNTNLQAGHSFVVKAFLNEWNFGATNFKYNTSNNSIEKMNGDFVLGVCVVDENTIKFKASCINNNYRIIKIILSGFPK